MSQNQNFARILFENKALRSNGQEYENLFVRIMEEDSVNFQPIKPQGSKGDEKNDGYNYETGEYYQCYAPEDLLKNIATALTKLQKSADGLVGYWDKISQIKKVYFVVNDKYQGVYPEIHQKLSDLHQQYPYIRFELFRTKDLERKLLNLDIKNIESVIGFLPNPQLVEIEADYITEVLQHLMNVEANIKNQEKELPDQIDFIRKIKHNELSDYVGNYLITAHYSIYKVNEYFRYNSNFAKDELQKKFIVIYKEETSKVEESISKSNIVFWNLFDRVCPRDNQSIQMAVLVLLAYYFEACDIFEEPK